MGIPIYENVYDDEVDLLGTSSSANSKASKTSTDGGCCGNCFTYIVPAKLKNKNNYKNDYSSNHLSKNEVSNATKHDQHKQQQQFKKVSPLLHQQHSPTKRAVKHLVGNGKEYRIEGVNKNDLCIIGNGNSVRISSNMGNVHIIGNATRLKINRNNGYIKYTGNDGRISLGNESSQQFVDYIGCNGILKICNATNWSATKKSPINTVATTKTTTSSGHIKNRGCTKSVIVNAIGSANKQSTALPAVATIIPESSKTSTMPKSASYAGIDWIDQCRQIQNNKNNSMPNLDQRNAFHNSHNIDKNSASNSIKNVNINENDPNCCNITIVRKSIGSIVIKNAVNITI